MNMDVRSIGINSRLRKNLNFKGQWWRPKSVNKGIKAMKATMQSLHVKLTVKDRLFLYRKTMPIMLAIMMKALPRPAISGMVICEELLSDELEVVGFGLDGPEGLTINVDTLLIEETHV
ncbi:30663_t:CDS:2 [Gigaspora margarita]|uniref:30663_t:CDS:1 n=1 Tax=Gigaspora margarita TaxID=4874 RepID=A0ABM8W162_GIGMA|nr:30663_t:CDS:2 [Gigaspora margarita]